MTNLEALMKFPSGFAGYVRTAKMVCHTLSILSLLDPFGSFWIFWFVEPIHSQNRGNSKWGSYMVFVAVICIYNLDCDAWFSQPLRQMRQWPGIFPTSYCLLLSCLKLRHIAMGSGGMIRATMWYDVNYAWFCLIIFDHFQNLKGYSFDLFCSSGHGLIWNRGCIWHSVVLHAWLYRGLPCSVNIENSQPLWSQ